MRQSGEYIVISLRGAKDVDHLHGLLRPGRGGREVKVEASEAGPLCERNPPGNSDDSEGQDFMKPDGKGPKPTFVAVNKGGCQVPCQLCKLQC